AGAARQQDDIARGGDTPQVRMPVAGDAAGGGDESISARSDKRPDLGGGVLGLVGASDAVLVVGGAAGHDRRLLPDLTGGVFVPHVGCTIAGRVARDEDGRVLGGDI